MNVAYRLGIQMSENESRYMAPLEAIATIFTYGIPALLIILGYFAYIYQIDEEMRNVGLALLIIGIIIYIVELIVRLVMFIEEFRE
jgi:hypothetical protein